jgi:polyisoprenoid-binding protein YceI
MRSSWLPVVSMVLSLYACDNEPGEGKPVATVGEPVAEQAPAPAQPTTPAPTEQAANPAAAAANQVNYTFSNADSKVEFVGAKVTGKHDGGFKEFTGNITMPEGKPEQGMVKIEIQTTSIYTDDEKLTKHLKTPDFFDVEKFGKATFTSTAVAPAAEAGKHTITGNLELHGVTKSISFPATIKATAEGVDADAEFVINRKDFGIVYPGKPDDLIKDDVLMKLQIRSKKAAST